MHHLRALLPVAWYSLWLANYNDDNDITLTSIFPFLSSRSFHACFRVGVRAHTELPLTQINLGTCQKLAGGEWGWKQRGGHNFLSLRKGRGHEKWAVKRGRVMQIYARDHVEVHPQKKKEVLYLAKKREKYNGLRNVMDINCEVL